MVSRILFSVALFAVLTIAPSVEAQTTNVQTMLARMQAIMLQMEELQKEFQTLASQVQDGNSGSVLGVSTTNTDSVFTEPLEYGETNDDIARIQKLLATDPEIYPYGVVSGFYGPKTTEAIRNLQGRFGLKQVGVIGPQTTDLLAGYMRAYPNENYPDGVLSTKPPTVLGASTGNPSTPSTPSVPSVIGINPAESIEVEVERKESWIEIEYTNGDEDTLVADTEDEDDIIEHIVRETSLTEAQVRAVIEFDGPASRSSSDSDADEDDAEDAIDDAEDAIDEADEEIDEADEDGDDVDWAEETLEEAEDLLDDAEDAFEDEDYDEAVELAEEAEELAEKAIDRIDEEKEYDVDDIEEIRAIISNGEAEIEVEYEDGEEDSFDVDEDDEDDIIEAVAEHLNMDEDDVEDLIEFEEDYGDLDEVLVEIEDGEAYVEVWFEDGSEKSLRLNETDEDEIIEVIADRFGFDEDEVEDLIVFR